LLHGFRKPKNVGQVHCNFAENRVITIDLLGHGETECLGYVHSMEDNAEAVQAVLAELRT
jgi:pimeloyl-ACP methyl ester carboxylesterase